MRHERLQDVAAASLVVFALLLGLVHLLIVGILETAGPFLRASLLLSLVAVLLAVLGALVLVLVALVGQFLMLRCL